MHIHTHHPNDPNEKEDQQKGTNHKKKIKVKFFKKRT